MNYIDCYNQYKNKIFSYFYYNLGKDRELAEDLTSETFLKGYDKIDSYDDTFSFSTWIFKIARNKLIDHYRKDTSDVSINGDENLDIEEFIKYEGDFTRKIDTEFDMKQVYMALDKIPETYKDYIVMKYLNEFSTKEISNITGKSEANIRKIISRGLERLINILQPNTPEYEKL
ncbi:RNA polymerase sigma factor [Candidatus Gracilibacteria bacterium 28_42_T64]|nr:RNA polymerase sigma factor [Candidatus Gracilibacteria bacterium 28_42_T64]